MREQERLQAARKSELPGKALHAQIRWMREKRKEERRAGALKPRAERGRIADAPPLLLPPPRHSPTLLPSHINASEGGDLGSHTSPGPYTKIALSLTQPNSKLYISHEDELPPNPPIELPTPPFPQDQIITRVVQPVSKTSALRWLRVYLDTRLSCKNHAEKMASKGRKTVSGLKSSTRRRCKGYSSSCPCMHTANLNLCYTRLVEWPLTH